MNKKKSLEKSIKLWKLLAQNGNFCKSKAIEQLGWQGLYAHNCPLCEYVAIKTNYHNGIFRERDCNHCPMKDKWGTDINEPVTLCTCVGSVYFEWSIADRVSEHKIAAEIMVTKMQEVLAELPKEQEDGDD